MSPTGNSKVMVQHLQRKAVVYLRQSSEFQVRHNRESQKLQYAMADQARRYGFGEVEVIDCDLGQSAAVGARRRDGLVNGICRPMPNRDAGSSLDAGVPPS